MGIDNLCLLMCRNYKREADAVIKSGSFPDVKVIAYPAICYNSGEEIKALPEFLPPVSGKCGRAVFIGGHCAEKFKLPASGLDKLRLQDIGSCFYMFANREIIDRYLRERAYLITPGFLGCWRQFIKEMELDQKSARKFFRLTSSKLVLLDTGTGRDTEKKLLEFAAFLSLPAEKFPAGLDYFRMFLKEIILEWRLEKEKALEKAPAEKKQQKRRTRSHAVKQQRPPEIHSAEAFKQSERREHKRFMMNRRCLVEINDSEMVELRDISLGGMRLSVSRNLPSGSIHSLKIFPSIKNEIHLKGKVVWSTSKDHPAGPDKYETGLRFIRINEEEKHSVERFLNILTL